MTNLRSSAICIITTIITCVITGGLGQARSTQDDLTLSPRPSYFQVDLVHNTSFIMLEQTVQANYQFVLTDVSADLAGKTLYMKVHNEDQWNHINIDSNPCFLIPQQMGPGFRTDEFEINIGDVNNTTDNERFKYDTNLVTPIVEEYKTEFKTGCNDTSILTNTEKGLVGSFNVTAVFFGYAQVRFYVVNEDLLESTGAVINARIIPKSNLLAYYFGPVMGVMMVVAMATMGTAIDIDIVIQCLKKPISPLIGLASQVILMPLTSYMVGYLLLYDTPPMWLAIFIYGCCPGGGVSNMWTYLLGGDINLSITMTIISTVVVLATLPFWVFVLGRDIMRDGYYGELPFGSIVLILFAIVVPMAVGIIIRKKRPNVADMMIRIMKPLFVVVIIIAVSIAMSQKYETFLFCTWKIFIASTLMPLLGFIFGAVFSILLRRPKTEVYAISVETGIQNGAICFAFIQIVLEDFQPMPDMTMIVPILIGLMTKPPLLIMIGIKKCFPQIEFLQTELDVQRRREKEEEEKKKQDEKLAEKGNINNDGGKMQKMKQFFRRDDK